MYNAQPGASQQGYMHPVGLQVRKALFVVKLTLHFSPFSSSLDIMSW
jgi:hypothetical protein